MSVRTYTNKHNSSSEIENANTKYRNVCVWLIIIDRYLGYVLVCVPEKVWNIYRYRESRMSYIYKCISVNIIVIIVKKKKSNRQNIFIHLYLSKEDS